jgi:hypothetical protein
VQRVAPYAYLFLNLLCLEESNTTISTKKNKGMILRNNSGIAHTPLFIDAMQNRSWPFSIDFKLYRQHFENTDWQIDINHNDLLHIV